MKHTIPVEMLGAHGVPMATAVQSCVHCGFCLPTCPTYAVLGEEMDSPRGRIVLMKQVLEGTMPLEAALPHVDACLGCLACETACPSGVAYRDLISPFRARAERIRDRSVIDRLRRWLVLQVLPHPARFRFLSKLGLFAKPFRRFLPAPMRAMLELLPARMPNREVLRDHYQPDGKPRARVALLSGCAQQVLAPEINAATIDVLVRNGVEVVIPRNQGCCGALGWHVGAADHAQRCAVENLDAFPDAVDAILTNAAGCGSCLHEYPLILRGTPDTERAEKFAHKVKDVAQFLDELGIVAPRGFDHDVIVALQDACHLLHAQHVHGAPRRILQRIPNLKLREAADAELCCGSAGTYNIDHPEIAAELGRRKAQRLSETGADFVLSGNIGCLTQLNACLPKVRAGLKAMHFMVLLRAAYEGRQPV